MGYGHGWMWGTPFPWVFWILIITALVVAAMVLLRRPAGGSGSAGPTALEILERRYAAGDISTEEFEERKARLSRTPR